MNKQPNSLLLFYCFYLIFLHQKKKLKFCIRETALLQNLREISKKKLFIFKYITTYDHIQSYYQFFKENVFKTIRIYC